MKVFSLSLLIGPALSESLYHFNQAGEVYKSDQKAGTEVRTWTKLGKWRKGPTPWHSSDPWTDISCNSKDQCWAISKDHAGNGLLWYVDATEPTLTRIGLYKKPWSCKLDSSGKIWIPGSSIKKSTRHRLEHDFGLRMGKMVV